MSEQKNNDIEVIDESDRDDDRSSMDKVVGSLTNEIEVFSQAASIYFGKFHDLHQGSEAKKKNSSLSDILTNAHKAHKAAWKHICENSEVHKENERQANRILPKSAIDNFHRWLDDSTD
ncbi:MAG: hypothetical protein MJA27_08380 [Pseudanabaenales cyanobacterium]|nr:hypothetical protein [Pseudanabaenales cyanobacterium]